MQALDKAASPEYNLSRRFSMAQKNDPPVVVGFRRLSWLVGILGTAVTVLGSVGYYYFDEVIIWAVLAGGAAFGFARILVLVVRAFKVGSGGEPKVITGFKRLSWLGTFFFLALVGIIAGFYDEPVSGFVAAFITGIVVFPLMRLLLVWIVKGFAGVEK